MTTDPKAGAGEKRVPDAKKAEIKRAIAMHVRSHGDCNWSTLRENPDFAPWIGEASGEAGRRAFFRWKKEVLRATVNSRTRPRDGQAVNDDQQAWAARIAQASAGTAVVTTTAQVMRHGPLVGDSIANLLRALQAGFDDIQCIRAVARVEDPSAPGGTIIVDPDLLLKASRTLAYLAGTAKGLLDRYFEISSREEFQEDLLVLVDEVLEGRPELRAEFLDGLAGLIDRHGGALPRAA